MKTFLILLTLSLLMQLNAKVLVSPLEAMRENYSVDAIISKKNILLSKKSYRAIQENASVKLTTKIYRIFTAKKDNNILGYGVLINRKVRSKNAVVLYFIADDILKGIEIIAFNEPIEYLPTKTWNSQFRDISTTKMLHLSRGIPSISGATLSARSVTDGSRVAFALYNELLKAK